MSFLDRFASSLTGPDGGIVAAPRRALTAAGARVNLSTPALVHTKRPQWQTDAWLYRETVAEMRFAGDFVANTLGRLRVFAAENRPRGQEPIPLEANSKRGQNADGLGVDERTIQATLAAVDALNINQHGSTLLGRFGENLEYAGECYLLGRSDVDGETSWSIRSVSEVNVTQGGAHLVEPGGGAAMEKLDPASTDLLRLWTPHPRYYDWPDAAVASLLDVLEGMTLLGKRGRAHDRSRISSGKALYVPLEFSMVRPGSAPVSADLAGVDDDGSADPFMESLVDYMTVAISDESDPSAVAPMIIRGPAMIGDRPAAEVLRTVDLHGEDPKNLDDRYEALVMRFARGINLAPERVKGIGESTTQWSAVSVTADEIKTSVEPRAERMCDALTAAYLRPALRAMGVPPEQRRKVCLWFDPSELVQNPNRADDAKAAHTAGAMSDAALLRHLGFDDGDAPQALEVLRRSVSRERLAATSVPLLTKILTGQMPTPEDVQALMPQRPGERPIIDATPKPGQPGPGPIARPDITAPPPVGERTQPAAVPAGVTAAAAPKLENWRIDRDLGRRLTQVDRDLTTRLLAHAEATVGRAVEKAANHIRGKAQKNPVRAAAFPPGVDPHAALLAAGPRKARELADGTDAATLLDGAFASLETLFYAEVARAADAVATALDKALADTPTRPGYALAAAARRPKTVQEQVAEKARAAWQRMKDRLREHAERVLFDGYTPSRDGEQDPGIVPTDIVRDALAETGGLPDGVIVHDETGRIVVDPNVTPPPRVPSGPGSGEVALDRLRVSGAAEVGFEWSYPPVPRQAFKPHQRLDGVTFTAWDDAELATSPADAEWIGASYYPGDHTGCLCYADSVFIIGMTEDASISAEEIDAAKAQLRGQ